MKIDQKKLPQKFKDFVKNKQKNKNKKILVLGITYKKNSDDIRRVPMFKNNKQSF